MDVEHNSKHEIQMKWVYLHDERRIQMVKDIINIRFRPVK